MALNQSKGNMYDFVTHAWNTVKGNCEHDCSYCYMKRWGKLNPIRFDEKELRTDLGSDNFIFVGSSTDLFANNVPDAWIKKTLKHCDSHSSLYLFQTNNPSRFLDYIDACVISDKSVLCTTIETNRYYPDIMGACPKQRERAEAMADVSDVIKCYVTIEPIIDFDLDEMVELIRMCNPTQVNIGADSGGNKLPEPSKGKLLALIAELQKFTTINRKTNLSRLLR